MKKRIVSALLALALCLGLTAPALAAGQTFEDVPPNHWAYQQIERAFADSAVGGSLYDTATGVRYYSPNDPLTLAQLIAILTRAFYANEVNASTAMGTWYAQNLAVAEAHNLLEGAKYESMDKPASRYNMAAMLANVLRDKGVTMPTVKERVSVVSKIADWGSIPIEYRQYVCDVYYLGIIGGIDTAGSFGGSQNMNRAQAAIVYSRVADAITGGTAPEQSAQPTPKPGTGGSSTNKMEYSEIYRGSVYYERLKNVELTGNYRQDIIAVAASQVGYRGGNSENDIAGDAPLGKTGDYTEYGRYFGSNGRAWCSEFASWCIRQAGVPESLIQSSRSASIEQFNAPYYTWDKTVFAGGNYLPKAGDLALLAWTGTSWDAEYLSHTAIIKDVEQHGDDVIITVIHGNTNNSVVESQYLANAADGDVRKGHLVYFVAPDYD